MSQFPTTEEQSDVEQRVLQVIAETFHVGPSDIGGDARMGSVPEWDSMGHMQLIVALERAFSLTIPNFAVADMVSVPDIVQAMKSLGNAS